MNNPYAPPHSHVSRPLVFPIPVVTPLETRALPLAARRRRLLAQLVDVAFVAATSGIGMLESVAWARTTAVLVVALSVLLTAAFGGTIGKLACGLRVVRDRDRGSLGVGQVLARSLPGALPIVLAAIYAGSRDVAVLGALAVAVVAWSTGTLPIAGSERRTVFDRLAGTLVVDARR